MTLTPFQAANPYNRVVVDQYGNTAADLARTGGRRTDTPGDQWYTVKQGDSPASIAGNIYGDQRMFADILAYNGNSPLRPGMRIYLPAQRKNPGVSDLTAAAWGMATSGQIAKAYDKSTLDLGANGKMNWTPWTQGQTGVTQGKTNRQAAYDVYNGKYKTLDEALAAQTGASGITGKAPTNPLLNNANPYKNYQKFRNADAASMATLGNNTGINAKISKTENAQGLSNQAAYNKAHAPSPLAEPTATRVSNNPGPAPIKSAINKTQQSQQPQQTQKLPQPGTPYYFSALPPSVPTVKPNAGRVSSIGSLFSSVLNGVSPNSIASQYSGVTSGGNTAAAASPAALVTYGPPPPPASSMSADVKTKFDALSGSDPTKVPAELTQSDVAAIAAASNTDPVALITTLASHGLNYALNPKTNSYTLTPLSSPAAYTVPDDWWPGMLGLNENIRYYQQSSTYTGRTITPKGGGGGVSDSMPYGGTINFTG
jgi:hypothetical protein